MRVTIFGSGYVGLVTGACLADVGNEVCCVDIDSDRIAHLNQGYVPIHEPGLKELIDASVAAGRLAFTTDIVRGVTHGLVQIIAVGTPTDDGGYADVSQVLEAARAIARCMDDYRAIVCKSTAPVGTRDAVFTAVSEELNLRRVDIPFSVISNPEFLKEGSAVTDFMRPDRIVVGADDERGIQLMRELYAPFERNRGKLLFMDANSAELTKYAANAMLATRISFMNELALLAERLGADIEQVRRGIGTDPRIGPQFLYAGCGYGGSCFPKDIRALLSTADSVGATLGIVRATEQANSRQKQVLLDKITRRLGNDLHGACIALWGLAFKPDTDDIRDAPSLVLIDALLARGAQIAAYDPVAMPTTQRTFGSRGGLRYSERAMDALEDADALVLVTEWKEFRSPNFSRIHALLRTPIVFDGRNILDARSAREAGLEYYGVGIR